MKKEMGSLAIWKVPEAQLEMVTECSGFVEMVLGSRGEQGETGRGNQTKEGIAIGVAGMDDQGCFPVRSVQKASWNDLSEGQAGDTCVPAPLPSAGMLSMEGMNSPILLGGVEIVGAEGTEMQKKL